MFSRFPSMLLPLVAGVLMIRSGTADAREIRFCADPNNLPFSHQDESGFENKLAKMVASEMGATARFVWSPQWRGFVRKTLQSGACDVIPGVSAGLARVRTTRPYYSSTYVFVTRFDSAGVSSFGDPALKERRIGVQLVGDDGANTPPVEELVARDSAKHVHGYMVWGRKPEKGSPLQTIIQAVADGEIDVAIVWGPAAGYFALREGRGLRVTPVSEGEATVLPMRFDISMGVRKTDVSLAEELDAAMERSRDEIEQLLRTYGVPLVGRHEKTGEMR